MPLSPDGWQTVADWIDALDTGPVDLSDGLEACARWLVTNGHADKILAEVRERPPPGGLTTEDGAIVIIIELLGQGLTEVALLVDSGAARPREQP